VVVVVWVLSGVLCVVVDVGSCEVYPLPSQLGTQWGGSVKEQHPGRVLRQAVCAAHGPACGVRVGAT
jgi:hypothetical protein